MNNQIQVFESQEFGKVRVIEIDGQPWWVLKDVAASLEISDISRLAGRLDDDELTRVRLVSGGQNRSMYAVTESGLYAVILRSDKPNARNFRRWITSEVLPSIRKHGAYMTDALLDEVTRSQDAAQELFARLQSEKANNTVLCEYVDELRPKALYHDTILKCTGAVQVSLIAKDYGMTAAAFNKLLHDLKVQFKMGKTWVLFKNYQDMGYTVTNTYYVGGRIASVHTLWTQRGRFFLYDLLRWHGISPASEKIIAMMGGDDNLC